MIGQYLNSLKKNSNYVLVGYTPLQADIADGKVSAGIIGGALTGYGKPVTTAVGLLGTYENKDFGINLIAAPNAKVDGKEIDGFLGLQTKYKIK